MGTGVQLLQKKITSYLVTVNCKIVPFSVIWCIDTFSVPVSCAITRKRKGGPLHLKVLHEKYFNTKARVCCRIHHIHPPFAKRGRITKQMMTVLSIVFAAQIYNVKNTSTSALGYWRPGYESPHIIGLGV